MTKYFRRGRSVTASLREDGTVYFEVSEPLGFEMGDLMLAVLWILAGATLIAAVFWI